MADTGEGRKVVRTRLTLVRVEELCECGGHLIYGNIILTSCPPWYPHTCDTCYKTFNLRQMAVRIVYE